MYTPSSSRTTTAPYGVLDENAGNVGGWMTVYDHTSPFPGDDRQCASVAPQRAHVGTGGCRGVLHALQHCSRSSPARRNAQNSASAGATGSGRGYTAPHRSTPNNTAPAGSLIAPHTNAISAPAT